MKSERTSIEREVALAHAAFQERFGEGYRVPNPAPGLEAAVISLVIRLARFAPDGAMAPTLRGLLANARKNNKRFLRRHEKPPIPSNRITR